MSTPPSVYTYLLVDDSLAPSSTTRVLIDLCIHNILTWEMMVMLFILQISALKSIWDGWLLFLFQRKLILDFSLVGTVKTFKYLGSIVTNQDNSP